jgi:hypothetical protein
VEEGEAEEAEEEEKERKREKFIGRRRRRRWINQNKRCERCLPPPHETSPSQVLRRRTGISYLRMSYSISLTWKRNGKISPAESAVYTDLFFKMTVNDDWG